jgi:lysyl-tRNA synthetase class 2
MALKDIIKTRLKKLKRIKNLGIEPYPVFSRRNLSCAEALKKFNSLVKSQREITLGGRIRSIRTHGGLTFIHLDDGTTQIQLALQKNKVGEKGYEFFLENFDIGDFIEVTGILFKTKKGEKTLEVRNFRILAKSLRPLPDKWYGLKDIEERYRKRYLDLIYNPEVKEKFILRAKIIKEIRSFLEKNGFFEVETPILQPIYGGAKARPFKTHHNALDIDLYLRISPELYLKRLLIGGFNKIYELGKCFRNEGIDRSHNPDFTMLEFYWAYADYKELMKFTEKFLSTVIKKIFGKLIIEYEGKKINFKTPWPRIEFLDLIKKETGINYEEINRDGLAKKAEKLGIKVDKVMTKAEIVDEIYKKVCRPKLWNPVFLIHHPAGFFPLAKAYEKDPKKLANFQLIVAGWELVNAFSELNDPIEQRKRFEEQEKLYKQGLEEAQRIDEDFLEALEYGMPPAAGWGMGIDRLIAILTNSHSLREIILFPTMRPKE